MVNCIICNRKFRRITNTHLLYKHRITPIEFVKKFPNTNRGLIPWNKDKTKETHLSLLVLSKKLKAQTEWNFSKWQRRNRVYYDKLTKDEELAELIGIILGDGNLYKCARTDNLRVICGLKDTNYIQHIASLIEKTFVKKPVITKRKNENAAVISIYQCNICDRLNLPAGNKIRNNVGIPAWIASKKRYMVKCLKGLFETDGCFVEDEDNYTQIIEFKNNCKKLREDVYNILVNLGYGPQLGRNYVRLAKKGEVYKFKEVIDFRNYN